ncbi:MAG: AAA family ATPase [Gemmataceae bacterium]|nr:AAA family ATPase [Gemmataceae bacterium]MCI0743428.1 AAA family ATPase [Gemmataceae bacterium]
MIRSITLVNFMSHVHTRLDLADGLTVLAGPNNVGKSAVVEAMLALCHNDHNEYVVRHGAKECRVIVETSDGHVIEWKRKAGTVTYTIDGQEFGRLKGGVPEKLHEVLRLPLVQSPDEKEYFDVHVAQQKDPIFLLDQPGRQAATFFASSSDASLLMQMQKLQRQKVADQRSEEKHLTQNIQELDEHLAALEPVEALDGRFADVETAYGRLVEDVAQINLLGNHIAQLVRRQQKAALERERARALSELPAPPEQADIEALHTLIDKIRTAVANIERQKGFAGALGALPAPPVFEDPSRLEEIAARLSRREQAVAASQARAKALAGLTPAPPLADTTALMNLTQRLLAARNAIGEQEEQLETIQQRLAQVEKESVAWVEKHPTCPTCGARIQPDKVLVGRGHVHAKA